MKNAHGKERRFGPRVEENFVVSYRVYGDVKTLDTSHTKNIGEGGMFLTTNRTFDHGTMLALELRLPFAPIPIRLLGKVIECREIAKNLIYETRLSFTYMDSESKEYVKNTVSYFVKKDRDQKR